jgi:hypothetical protein
MLMTKGDMRMIVRGARADDTFTRCVAGGPVRQEAEPTRASVSIC